MTRMLTVTSSQLGAAEVQSLARDLVSSINDHTDAKAALPEGAAKAGERGDPVTLGTIALSVISSGTVVALFQVIKSYFERDESLHITFVGPDGKKLDVRAQNMSPARLEETMASVQAMFAKS